MLSPFFSSQLSTKPFTNKDFFVKVQMHVELRLNEKAAFVHPYCLSLDSITNALYSLVTNKYITKLTVANVVQYTVNFDELDQLSRYFQRLCSVLRCFNGLRNYDNRSKL